MTLTPLATQLPSARPGDHQPVAPRERTPADYIANLPAWDGTRRLSTWLPHVLDASPQTDGMFRTEYLARVGCYWLLGMVRRAIQPGCNFDFCPVLEGEGGTGKSVLLQILAGRDCFCDKPLSNKDWCLTMPEVLQNFWLYEISDLAALRKAEKEALKFFICTTHDEYRPPYHAQYKISPRQFVVVGTTNSDSWRRNIGLRRFWPVPVPHAINLQWVRTYRDQLFAEANARVHELDAMQDLSGHPGNPGAPRRGGVAA